jgi:hypothetical protein
MPTEDNDSPANEGHSVTYFGLDRGLKETGQSVAGPLAQVL